jgi:hypothetical protein
MNAYDQQLLLSSLVGKATDSKQHSLDAQLLSQIKTLCKISDENVRQAFELVYDRLKQPDSQVHLGDPAMHVPAHLSQAPIAPYTPSSAAEGRPRPAGAGATPGPAALWRALLQVEGLPGRSSRQVHTGAPALPRRAWSTMQTATPWPDMLTDRASGACPSHRRDPVGPCPPYRSWS